MPLNKFVIPAALGLSVVTVTAFVVYYIFKKDEGTSDRVKTSRVNVIEIKVPKSIVPAVIGRNGSNIKEIERKTGSLIHFKKFSEEDYDVCIIRGRSEATQIAETCIHDFIKSQPIIIQDAIMVPNWAVGKIIGTGGENISEMCHQSGARIKVNNQYSGESTQHNIDVKGTKEQIEVAKNLIRLCVAQEKCRREIEQSKRTPRHVPSPSASPVDNAKDIPGESNPNKHIKYKRPETGTAGSSIEVYVSAVSSPSRFWVQLVGTQVAQLDELVDHMTEYYSNRQNRELHALSHVSIGQVVAAVFRHDGRWYRARVHDIKPNEFDSTKQVADVFFVDYGDSEYVGTNELCELRADLLKLRFQAMECFLAGVRPVGKEEDVVGVTATGQRWDKWHPHAIERFEELTKVARWKSLVSRTCTYKKITTGAGEKEREIPGIKLFDVTDEGEIDIGEVLISEGLAEPQTTVNTRVTSPSTGPPTPLTPFGDLGNSRVLGMLGGGGTRSSSMPKDHKDEKTGQYRATSPDGDQMTSSKSLSSGLEKHNDPKAVSNIDMLYSQSNTKHLLNGSHENFLNTERTNLTQESSSTETLVPNANISTPSKDEFKANINRIDSSHKLDTLSGKNFS